MRLFRRKRKHDEEDNIIEGEIEDIAEDSEDLPGEADSVEEDLSRFAPPQPQDEDTRPPLERVAPDIPTPDEMALTPYTAEAEAPPQKRRLWLPRIRLPQLLVWRAIHPGMLLLAVGLVSGGVFWTMHNRGQTSTNTEAWWPAVLLGFALVWALFALATRRAASFLAASALAGIGISLLLDTQDYITWRETLVGVVLITVGVGIVARGLLLRQGSIATN